MKYGVYLKEHGIWIILFTFLFISSEIFLLVFEGSEWLMIYLAVAIVTIFFLGTYVDYHRWKKYFNGIETILEELDPKYLLSEMTEERGCQEQRKFQEILHTMSAGMNDKVAYYRRNTEEYKEYVETWVHEIKTPIAASRMILANHKDSNLGLEEEIERMEKYVEQALFYARSNDVEKDYLINHVNLRQVVQDVILKRKREFLLRKGSVEMSNLNRNVFSDSKWLSFMIGQILDNSIKYGKKEGLRIDVTGEERDNTVLLRITDNGPGISESELGRVFDKGFTGTNGRGEQASTGLGLYLCRKLCERLEHQILIESKKEVGTTVTFLFPKSDMTSVAHDDRE